MDLFQVQGRIRPGPVGRLSFGREGRRVPADAGERHDVDRGGRRDGREGLELSGEVRDEAPLAVPIAYVVGRERGA